MSLGLVLVLITAIIAAMVVLTELIDAEKKRITTAPKDAEAILADRFARGEIDSNEYADRMWQLRIGPPLQID